MEEKTGSRGPGTNVQILIAIIGLIGVLGGAVFANWDKIFPKKEQTVRVPESSASSSAATTDLSGSKVDSFVGHWRNDNPESSGITKVDIDARLNQIIVRMWGRCHPTDCDWGTQSVPTSASDNGVLQITWNQGFDVTRQKIELLPDKRLQVAGHTHFTDNSGRPDYDDVHYFVKP